MDTPVLAFGAACREPRTLSDEAFLRAIAWARLAPTVMVRAAGRGDLPDFVRAWRERLVAATDVSPVDEVAALWSRHAFPESAATTELVEIARKLPRRPQSVAPRLRSWLERDDRGSLSPLELVILLELQRHLSAVLPSDELWRLWRTTFTGAVELSGHAEPPPGSVATEDQRSLVLGELPIIAGLVFADVRGAAAWQRRGARHLRQQLLDLTDADGTPCAELLERLSFWLAPLVRASDWARRSEVTLWDEEARLRFRAVMKMASPLCVGGGRLALSNGFAADRTALLTTGLTLAGWTDQQPPLQAVRAATPARARSGQVAPSARRPIATDVLPAVQSDWARLGCLRTDWSPEADTLVVVHHEVLPRMELSVRGRTLLSGDWGLEIAVEGETVELTDDWSCVCWHSDEDADYLELQLHFDGGPRIERQVLLSRKERFALLADSISEVGGRRIDYRSRLPLFPGVTALPETTTRSCQLMTSKPAARLFPLALPCDRVQSAAGEFQPHERGLELHQTAIGGLYAPVVLDWHQGRRRADAEWRTLTVTEDRAILKTDAASAHRLRIGAHQLLVYRALSRGEVPRAVLGYHTAHETAVGLFQTSGTMEPILLVE